MIVWFRAHARLVVGLGLVVWAVLTVTAIAVVGGTREVSALADIDLTDVQEDGRQLFVDSCSGCHALDATASTGANGPDLDALGREGMSAPLVRVTIKQGVVGEFSHMPAELLDEIDARAVGEFLDRTAGCPRPTIEFGTC